MIVILNILSSFKLTSHPEADADDLCDLTNLRPGLSNALTSYLYYGHPRPGALITDILTVKSHQFFNSPAGKAVKAASLTPPSPSGSDANISLAQAFTESIKELQASSRPETDHHKVKLALTPYPPFFWADMDRKQYGARFIPCPEYSVAVKTTPLDPRGLAARPLITVGRVHRQIAITLAGPTYPILRRRPVDLAFEPVAFKIPNTSSAPPSSSMISSLAAW